MKKFPWYYPLLSIFPLLFLWTDNRSQIDAQVVIRPMLYTLAGSAILFLLLLMLIRNQQKAGAVGVVLLAAFFTYGRVYYMTRSVPALQFLNHHSILIPIYLVVCGTLFWLIIKAKRDYWKVYLTIVAVLLVGFQVIQICYATIISSLAANKNITTVSGLTIPAQKSDLPDIYIFVLDAYMRSDALQQDLGYDNSDFIQQLEQLGFYVPECSHPNYTFTAASISSMLNMRYIPTAYENDTANQFLENGFWSILKNNEVFAQLKSIGYKTIAFEEEYPFLQFNNADILIGASHPSINANYLYPFEAMYKQTTALIIFNALDPQNKLGDFFLGLFSKPSETSDLDLSGLSGINREFVASHIINTRFILDHIEEVPDIAGPKVTYAHLFIPHYPYVFGPDGEILTDPGYYSGDRGGATSDEYEKQGYVNQVEYINKQIIPILQNVISESKNPPIIILMGDHGLSGSNRFTNLEAYYFPGEAGTKLYEDFSPVNTFRLIFSEYFDGNYELLPDLMYYNDNDVTPDLYPNCAP